MVITFRTNCNSISSPLYYTDRINSLSVNVGICTSIIPPCYNRTSTSIVTDLRFTLFTTCCTNCHAINSPLYCSARANQLSVNVVIRTTSRIFPRYNRTSTFNAADLRFTLVMTCCTNCHTINSPLYYTVRINSLRVYIGICTSIIYPRYNRTSTSIATDLRLNLDITCCTNCHAISSPLYYTVRINSLSVYIVICTSRISPRYNRTSTSIATDLRFTLLITFHTNCHAINYPLYYSARANSLSVYIGTCTSIISPRYNRTSASIATNLKFSLESTFRTYWFPFIRPLDPPGQFRCIYY